MKRWKALFILSLALFLNASLAQALYDEYDDFYTYAGGGLHFWDAAEADAVGLKLRLGQQLGTFVGAEMQFAMGGEDKTTDVSLERLFGFYATFGVPLERLRPYAKLGLNTVSLETAGVSNSEFEVGYGLGVAIDLNPRVFLDLDYMMYLETADVELSGFTLGAGYRF